MRLPKTAWRIAGVESVTKAARAVVRSPAVIHA